MTAKQRPVAVKRDSSLRPERRGATHRHCTSIVSLPTWCPRSAAFGAAMRAAPWFASCVSALGSSSSQLGAVSSSGGGGALLRALTGSPELAAAPGSSLRPVPLSHVPCASSHSSTSSSPINNISSSRSCCTDNTESANSSNSASSESAHAATPARLSATWPPLARRHRVLAPRLPAAAGAAGGALGGGAAEAEACSSGMQPAQQLPVCAAAAAATRLNGLRCCLHTSSAAAAAASAATAASASSAAAAGGGGGGSCRTGSGGGSGEGTGASGRGDRGGGGAGAGWGRGAGGGGGGGAGGSGGGGAPPREEGLGAVLEVFNKWVWGTGGVRTSSIFDISATVCPDGALWEVADGSIAYVICCFLPPTHTRTCAHTLSLALLRLAGRSRRFSGAAPPRCRTCPTRCWAL